MAEFEIKRAERSQSWLRIALAGASGSGKTWSGLTVAKGIAEALRAAGRLPGPIDGKIGVICTERGSAQLYAHIVPFDVIVMEPPYSPDRYIRAIRALEHAGCAVIMVDQISHAWAGSGGVLEIANKAGQGTVFGHISEVQNQFLEDLLATNAHLIVTMRSKTEWVLEDYINKAGKPGKRPKRIGMAPVQRAGVEFEFTTLTNLDTETNLATVLKDRTQVLDKEKPFKFTEDHGRRLVEWMLGGAELEDEPEEVPPLTRAQAVCDAACRMMEAAKTIPDRGRIYHQHKAKLAEFLEEVPAEQLGVLRGAMRACYDRLAAQNPAMGAVTGRQGAFLTGQDVDQIEQLLQRAHIPVHELLMDFEVSRVGHIPHADYDKVVGWIIDLAGKNGDVIERPARVVPQAEPPKITANSLIEEEAKRRGKPAPLFE